MTHDVKSYIITQHHTSWYESKAVYYEIQGQKTHKGGVARVAEKWTCLLHPCAIQYPHYQRIRSICLQWQHSETVCIQYWLSHINGLWLCVCDALLCGCEDWSWSAHWAQFAAKVLKTFACWVPCVRSPKCHAKESQSSHHPYLCPLQLIWQEIHGETAIARHLWRLPCSETHDILILVSIHRCSLDLELFKSCILWRNFEMQLQLLLFPCGTHPFSALSDSYKSFSVKVVWQNSATRELYLLKENKHRSALRMLEIPT